MARASPIPNERTSPACASIHNSGRPQETRELTHETFLPGLVPDTLNFADIFQCHAVFAEETAVDDEIALSPLGRKDDILC